ncbi:aminoacyl-histidine dipeptidase [Campylobacter sp. MIT 12-8780]|uniref:M20/M25/M40 family metallo-hydrolase n=1 Tax=unclassified Campylobacter TaxID=2593542 RepID=UPI00115DEC21|nr:MULTISPECIES: M20/M25/M40 family metallo-hydrolase [unclassified Campylobacter]NDJ26928.1 aminoacyl-histidine dipeptidase [Campylobacter sp. MIT 19-121]TQR41929.1 aminoacyl-histidine dipeptidase [Campylobacter sp. MIT 12-8780]
MQEVLGHFTQISQIPHCSFDTIKLKQFLEQFAKEAGFKVTSDKAGNIHCIKGEPQICLQAHYDMVCMGEAPKIELFEENGFLKAKNSSLGADNGIGLAMILAAMREFKNLECLLTNDEEVGLLGANAFEGKLCANKLLNLDHEIDDEVVIGCAGGVDIEAILPFTREKMKGKLYELEAVGFKGGHSGMDIINNVKSSIKELAAFIFKNEGVIVEFEGGERINSIPKHAKALVCFKNEPLQSEHIKCKFINEAEFLACAQSQNLLYTINAFSQGVRAFDKHLNIVQTSINLSLLKMKENAIQIELFARSNTLEGLRNLEFETKTFFESFGFKTSSSNFYAPWEGQENDFTEAVLEELKKEFKTAQILAVHAGLECGVLEKKQALKCASIGPNIFNPHSIDERLDLASTAKIYKVVQALCARFQ